MWTTVRKSWRRTVRVSSSVFGCLMLQVATVAFSPEVVAADLTKFRHATDIVCSLKGKIEPKDLFSFQKMISTCNQLMIDSPGGDMQSAMRIGRMVRQKELLVVVPVGGECASACVFIYAAGVLRANYGPVKIHRPYLIEVSDSTLPKTQKQFDDLGREARRYLKEMNVRESLFEAMLIVSPENSYTLGIEEMEGYGMGRHDPVYVEYWDNTKAKAMGLSKVEFLKLKSRVGKICGALSPLMKPDIRECWKREAPGSIVEWIVPPISQHERSTIAIPTI